MTFQLSASVSGASFIPKKLRSATQTEIKEVCFQGWWGGGGRPALNASFCVRVLTTCTVTRTRQSE